MLGIYMPYRPCRETFVGLGLAEAAESLHGLTGGCLLMSNDTVTQGMHPLWDKRVHNFEGLDKLYDWLSLLDGVIWVAHPSHDEVIMASELGVNSTYYVTDDIAISDHRPQCAFSDLVVCPSWYMTSILKDTWQLPFVKYVPWCPPLLPTTNTECPAGRKLLVVMPFRSSGLSVHDVVTLVSKQLAEFDDCEVTVLLHKSVPRASVRLLARANLVYGGRLRHLTGLGWHDTVAAMLDADLVALLDHGYGMSAGMYPLTALFVGTPVIAWDTPAAREYLHHNTNAHLVVRMPDFGEQTAGNSLRNYTSALSRLMKNTNTLKKIKKSSNYGLDTRIKASSTAWKSIWN